ncbi:MAG: nuclease-related domain-containing protein [Thermoleophilia bacterium]
MARIIGTPGESAGARGLRFVFASIVAGGILVAAATWALGRGSTLGQFGAVVAGLITAAFYWHNRSLIRDIVETLREGRNFLQGALGEVRVHQELKSLPDEYIVFNDFHPVDATGKPAAWNVDHIVIGPTGVFVLDAKYYKNPRVRCAANSSFSRKNVNQANRNAFDLKKRLVTWSSGELEHLFVVPVVVYAQPDASLECLREGAVRTLPLRLLRQEVLSHSEGAIDQERAGRVARVLFSQIARDLQASFKTEFDAYGALAKAARYEARDARIAAKAGVVESVLEATAPPDSCPLCGGKLVRRVAKHGERAGKPFLGCENYARTKCRFGWNLEE